MNSVGRILLQALVLGALASAPAYAQSEFAGERFPYRAFDRLPKTTIAIGGGTLDVGFAPGAFTLPRSALMPGSNDRRKRPRSILASFRSPRPAS